MKKLYYLAAMTMAMLMLTGTAMAETTDIGLGRMDSAEFAVLRQMVSGEYQSSASVSTQRPREIRVAEFNLSDVESIRQAMAGGRFQGDATAFASTNTMVDIGTGSMSTREFCDLNKLVASNAANPTSGFTFICP